MLLDADGWIPSFTDREGVQAYAARGEIVLENEEPILHDLDGVARWLDLRGKVARKCLRRTRIDCAEFLAAWNLFADVESAVRKARKGKLPCRHLIVYDKLFHGCNLPAITPPGMHCEPIWSNAEVGILRRVLGKGLQLFRRRLRCYPSDLPAV